MAVIASLVIGENGATTVGGISTPLSSPADRERFIARHRSAAAFIIGKNSARIESYSKSNVPIFIFSRNNEHLHFDHPNMQQVTVDRNLREITELIDLRIDGDIVVEAGIGLLIPMIEVGAIDILELSITPISGDGNFVDVEGLLNRFEIAKDVVIDGTRLLECRYNRNASNS